ncbi:MAG: hypothetical protein EPO51_16180 [Phenylobacterium sp.]|uniref:hypothetical protein n=1 Tax=Phenylobacterium sp. TaxID=1871053 RepID=UPI00120E2F1C|nr:hypothetical protein [Phenylobacterium sp.]TAJ70632.1 MAG: hypothetical protein EPO51_16180 [Phenylobacterium sp.]
MLRTSLVFVSTALLLAGCGRGLTQVEEAAEDARISTERMIDNAEARSNAKQAEIFAMAAKMRREETESREGPRYEARKDGAGDNWMIYDNRTGAPATIGNEVMMGLTRAQVSAKLSHMASDGDQVFRK